MPAARPFSIPTIDISAFLSDPTSPLSQEIIDQVTNACANSCFFQIIGHRIPESLQTQLFDGSHKFFSLPFPTKKALDSKRNPGMRGYDLLASQAYPPGILPDLKEGYWIGPDLPLSHPSVVSKRFFSEPSVGPSPDVLPREDFRDPAEKYFDALLKLSATIMCIISAGLPYSGVEETFEKFVTDPVAILRLLNYPPGVTTSASGETEEEAIWQFCTY